VVTVKIDDMEISEEDLNKAYRLVKEATATALNENVDPRALLIATAFHFYVSALFGQLTVGEAAVRKLIKYGFEEAVKDLRVRARSR